MMDTHVSPAESPLASLEVLPRKKHESKAGPGGLAVSDLLVGPLPPERFIRIREVLHRVGGFHRATLYKWIKDGRFPRQVALGANSSAWYESDIVAWVADPTGWRPPEIDQ